MRSCSVEVDDALAEHAREVALAEDEEVVQRLRPLEGELARLDTIPGIGRAMAELLIAEIGVDMAVSREYPPTSDGLRTGVLEAV